MKNQLDQHDLYSGSSSSQSRTKAEYLEDFVPLVVDELPVAKDLIQEYEATEFLFLDSPTDIGQPNAIEVPRLAVASQVHYASCSFATAWAGRSFDDALTHLPPSIGKATKSQPHVTCLSQRPFEQNLLQYFHSDGSPYSFDRDTGTLHPSNDRIVEISQQTAPIREEDSLLEKLRHYSDQREKNKVAPSTQNQIMQFQRRYDRIVRTKASQNFASASGSTIAVNTMNHLISNERMLNLAPSSRAAFLKIMRKAVEMSGKCLGANEEVEFSRMLKHESSDDSTAKQTNRQNAYRAVTNRDFRHLINSALIEREGKSLTYTQVHTIWMGTMSRTTSRRFFEIMSICIPNMTFELSRLSNGEEVRGMTFEYAYDKNSKYCVYSQYLASTNGVEDDGVLWTLILLQILGVISSALDVWRSGLSIVHAPMYFSARELSEELTKASAELNVENQRMLSSGKTVANQCVWDRVVLHNKSKKRPRLHHALLCNSGTMKVTSQLMTYKVADEKLSQLGRQFGYISSRQLSLSITGCRKDWVQRNANSLGNSNLAAHAGHTRHVAETNYLESEASRKMLPSTRFLPGMSEDAMKYYDDASDQRRTAFYQLQG